MDLYDQHMPHINDIFTWTSGVEGATLTTTHAQLCSWHFIRLERLTAEIINSYHIVVIVAYYPVIVWHNPDKLEANDSAYPRVAMKWK